MIVTVSAPVNYGPDNNRENKCQAVVANHLRLLMERFLNRTDVLACKGKSPFPVYPEPEQVVPALLGHLTGEGGPTLKARSKRKGTEWDVPGPHRLGSYSPAPDGSTLWGLADVDGETHKGKYVADTLAASLRIKAAWEGAGLVTHLERSKSGAGWHCWCLFDRPVEAALVRRVLRALLPRDIPLEGGGFASAGKGGGLELFPKRDDANTAVGLGNQVWLPYYFGATEGCNVFHRETAPGVVEPYEPDDLATNGVQVLEAIARRLDEEDLQREQQQASNPFVLRPTASPRRSYDGDREPEPIDSILDKALGQLAATGHRHDSVVWFAAQLRDNRHGEADARQAVREFARHFPAKPDDAPYGEAEALADLADIWNGRAPRRPSGRLKKNDRGNPKPPPAESPRGNPPKITSGPAAQAPPPLFDLKLPEAPPLSGCPHARFRTIRRAADHDDHKTVLLGCRGMRCDHCRVNRLHDYLCRAEAGIRRDLAAGRSLALFDGEGVGEQTMAARLRHVGGRYVHARIGGRHVVVCTTDPGRPTPCGCAAIAPAAAETKLREVERSLRAPPPEDAGGRYRPVSLGRAWSAPERSRLSLIEGEEAGKKEETKSASGGPNPFRGRARSGKWEVVRDHPTNDLDAAVGVLRSFGVLTSDGREGGPYLLQPRHGGCVLRYRTTGMDNATKEALYDALDALPRAVPPGPREVCRI